MKDTGHVSRGPVEAEEWEEVHESCWDVHPTISLATTSLDFIPLPCNQLQTLPLPPNTSQNNSEGKHQTHFKPV